MLLNSIHVRNYRTLEDIELEFSRYYTAISGKNNCGKSNLIRCLQSILGQDRARYGEYVDIDYQDDRTKWASTDAPIEIACSFTLSSTLDPGLFRFIEKQTGIILSAPTVQLNATITIPKPNAEVAKIAILDRIIDGVVAFDIIEQLRKSQLAIFHQSAEVFGPDRFFFSGGRFRALHQPNFSAADLEQLGAAQKALQAKLKKIARQQKEGVSELLQRLDENISIEFTIPEHVIKRGASFAINLKDKSVEVPFFDWGSGTQNQTRILLSILAASRIRGEEGDESRITPIVIIEEPESFLHPEAQAVFGRALPNLAKELEVQIISTTHSPYMLCQQEPGSNILLSRIDGRGRKPKTVCIETENENWMEPFGRVLGLDNAEFAAWANVFRTNKDVTVLVEGETDRRYFEHLRNVRGFTAFPSEWEVLSYGGKDALKNSILLKFFLSKFNKTFITFDLDALQECESALTRIGLRSGDDYCSIGNSATGQQCIEGLVPKRIISEVASKNTDIVMALTSADGSAKKKAREQWKSKVVEAFEARTDYEREELVGFSSLIKTITTAIKRK